MGMGDGAGFGEEEGIEGVSDFGEEAHANAGEGEVSDDKEGTRPDFLAHFEGVGRSAAGSEDFEGVGVAPEEVGAEGGARQRDKPAPAPEAQGEQDDEGGDSRQVSAAGLGEEQDGSDAGGDEQGGEAQGEGDEPGFEGGEVPEEGGQWERQQESECPGHHIGVDGVADLRREKGDQAGRDQGDFALRPVDADQGSQAEQERQSGRSPAGGQQTREGDEAVEQGIEEEDADQEAERLEEGLFGEGGSPERDGEHEQEDEDGQVSRGGQGGTAVERPAEGPEEDGDEGGERQETLGEDAEQGEDGDEGQFEEGEERGEAGGRHGWVGAIPSRLLRERKRHGINPVLRAGEVQDKSCATGGGGRRVNSVLRAGTQGKFCAMWNG